MSIRSKGLVFGLLAIALCAIGFVARAEGVGSASYSQSAFGGINGTLGVIPSAPVVAALVDGTQVIGSTGTTSTVTGVTFGPAFAGRVICTFFWTSGGFQPTAAVLDGVPLTMMTNAVTSGLLIGCAELPNDTSGNLVVTLPTSGFAGVDGAMALSGSPTAGPVFVSLVAGGSTTINVPANGSVLAYATNLASQGTWTGATLQGTYQGGDTYALFNNSSAGIADRTISYSTGSGSSQLLVVAFSPATSQPPAAAFQGYKLSTFASTFNPAKFNSSGSNTPGNEWYLYNFLGTSANNSGLSFNSDGSLQITGVGLPNGQVSTAAQVNSTFVGTAFGGGAYFEATLKFNPANINTANGWPAFWSMAIEHLINSAGPQWPGQAANYAHFAEADIFEYETNGAAINYSGTLHDWYGISGTTCPSTFCNISSAATFQGLIGIDWTQYHKLGLLWVPATATSSGSATFFLDNIQMAPPITWTQYTNQVPPPGGSASWTYGILDTQHIPLILGTGIGQGLTVLSVNAWQASSSGNLVQ